MVSRAGTKVQERERRNSGATVARGTGLYVRFLKRALDVAGSLAGLILVSPLIEQLKKLPEIIERKRQNARLFSSALGNLAGNTPPAEGPRRTHVYMLYTIKNRAEVSGISRDALRNRLADAGIETRVCFPPLHRQPIFQKGDSTLTDCPVAERVAAQIISLPFHSKGGNRVYDGVPGGGSGLSCLTKRIRD